MKLYSPATVRQLISKYNFRFQKNLGQNFLVDGNIVNRIVHAAGIDQEDIVLEIGAGIGTLTRALAQKAAGVIVIEVDRNLETVLEETLAGLDNVEIFWGNALDTNFDDLVSSKTGGPDTTGGKPYKAVANLPYYITTPLIMHALEGHFNISLMVIMVQKEVADRITAVPGTKAYGALTLAVNYYCEPRVAFKVPRTVFIPQPEVDSAVVCLKRRDNPPAFVEDEQIFFRVIRAAFGQRRKTLANALYSAAFGPEKDDINKMLSALGIDPKRRGETLSFNEFAMIANKMHIMLEHK